METIITVISAEKIIKILRKLNDEDGKEQKKLSNLLKNNIEELKKFTPREIKNILFELVILNKPSKGFNLFKRCGVLEIIIPEVDCLEGVSEKEGYFHKDVYHHTMKIVDRLAEKTDKLNLRLAGLLHDIGKPVTKKFIERTGWTFHGHDEIGARMIKKIGKRLQFDNETVNYLYKLTRLHLRPINLSNRNVTDTAVRRLIKEAGPYLEDQLTLCRTDITSGNRLRVKQHLRNFDFVNDRIREVIEKDRERAFRAAIDGFEIMQICGIEPGPVVGKLKKDIEDAVKSGKVENEHDVLVEYLHSIKNKYL